MDILVLALGPAFVLALAIQQLTELLVVITTSANASDDQKAQRKAVVLAVAAVVGGFAAASYVEFRVVSAFSSATGSATSIPNWIDIGITALVVAGGTETLNSFLKFLGYTKEKKEAEAEKLEAEKQLIQAQTTITQMQIQAAQS